MKTRRTFGQVLRDARERAGLKQTELAKRAGVGRSSLAEYERGKRLPNAPFDVEMLWRSLGGPGPLYELMEPAAEETLAKLREGPQEFIDWLSHRDRRRTEHRLSPVEEPEIISLISCVRQLADEHPHIVGHVLRVLSKPEGIELLQMVAERETLGYDVLPAVSRYGRDLREAFAKGLRKHEFFASVPVEARMPPDMTPYAELATLDGAILEDSIFGPVDNEEAP